MLKLATDIDGLVYSALVGLWWSRLGAYCKIMATPGGVESSGNKNNKTFDLHLHLGLLHVIRPIWHNLSSLTVCLPASSHPDLTSEYSDN